MNKMKKCSGWGLLIVLLMPLASPAAQLSYSFSTNSMEVGDTVTLTASVSGLGAGMADSLGSYTIKFLWASDFFSLDTSSISFGNGLDLGVVGDSDQSWYDVVSSSPQGAVTLEEFSYIPDFELDANQSDSFDLFSMNYTALQETLANYYFATGPIDLGDALGDPLTLSGVSNGGLLEITANSGGTPVPLPPAVWLMGSALAGLIGYRRAFREEEPEALSLA